MSELSLTLSILDFDMVLQLLLATLVLVPAATLARASQECLITDIAGEVRVQHPDGEWDELREGVRVIQNDVLETGENGIATLELGSAADVVVGTGSKALVSYSTGSDRKAALTLNVFDGTVWVEAAQECTTSVFTAGAVVEAVGDAVAVVFDPETNETSVQIIGGDSVNVRSVAEHRGRWLSAGQTTVVVPGTGSSAPRAFNEGHVTVLGHHLGKDFVDGRIQHYELLPKAADAGGIKALPGGSDVALSPEKRASTQRTTYPRLFTANRVYGSILEDRAQRYWFYRPVQPQKPLFDSTFSVGLSGGAAISNGNTQWCLALSPTFDWRFIDVGLDVEFAENHAGWTVPAFIDGVEGVLDVVDHLRIGYPEDSLFIAAERLEDYTVGDGLVVRHLDTRKLYSLYQPLGLHGLAALFEMLYVQGFVSDLSDFAMAGLRTEVRLDWYTAALGYYYVDEQALEEPMPGAGDRFSQQLVDTLQGRPTDTRHIAELSVGADVVHGPLAILGITGGVGFDLQSVSDGEYTYQIEGPTFVVDVPRVRFGLGYVVDAYVERDDDFRYTNRGRGPRVFCYAQPVRGLAFEGEFIAPLVRTISGGDSSWHYWGSYDYFISVSVNDSLAPFLNYAGLSLKQFNGGTAVGAFGFRTRFQLQTKPLILNTAVECGAEYYRVDFNRNGNVDSDDGIFEFSLGLRWGLPR